MINNLEFENEDPSPNSIEDNHPRTNYGEGYYNEEEVREMVKINKITPPTLDIYEPNGNLLGTVNEYEFLDVRVQIRKNQLSGYYLIFNGKKIRIDRNGELESYPDGLLGTMSGLYCQLL